MLVAAHYFGSGEARGPVGKDGAVFDEGLVGQGVGGDENRRTMPDSESDDWAVFGDEGAEGGLDFGEGFS